MDRDQPADREQTVKALRAYFEAHPENVVCAYLFGSVARGEARLSSDVDVGVLLERVPDGLDGLGIGLGYDLSDAVGREVQVVVLNNAPVDLAYRVLRDGILVADREPTRRAEYEVRVRSEYPDLLPYLRRYRRSRVPDR
jgi:predicted nucleotidyltransferase